MAETSGKGPTRALGLLVSVAIIAAAGYLVWSNLRHAELNPLSEDAVLTADVVHVAPSVPGRIQSFGVAENGKVAQGELLFALDPATYKLAVDQAAADLRAVEATLETQRRTIKAEQSNAVIAQEQVTRAQANLALAEQTLARLVALRPKGYVSAQQVDDAATAKRDAEVSLRQALQQAAAADALVTSAAAAEALVEARRAALAIAEKALADTQVRAPNDGRVVGLSVSPGEFVVTGQTVFTLINTEAWFASAGFRETDLSNIKVGDCATVYALADRSIAITGKVEGIGWGVASEEAINIPRSLPYVPKTLDWVRVAQRFPVRVRLLDPPEGLMRVGASAIVQIDHGKSC